MIPLKPYTPSCKYHGTKYMQDTSCGACIDDDARAVRLFREYVKAIEDKCGAVQARTNIQQFARQIAKLKSRQLP